MRLGNAANNGLLSKLKRRTFSMVDWMKSSQGPMRPGPGAILPTRWAAPLRWLTPLDPCKPSTATNPLVRPRPREPVDGELPDCAEFGGFDV